MINEETGIVIIYREPSLEQIHFYVAVPLADVTALEEKLTAFIDTTAPSQEQLPSTILGKPLWVASGVSEQDYTYGCAEFLSAEYDGRRPLTSKEQERGKRTLEKYETGELTLKPNNYVPEKVSEKDLKQNQISRRGLLTLIETAIQNISTGKAGIMAISAQSFLETYSKIISMERGKKGMEFQQAAGNYWMELRDPNFNAEKIKPLLEKMKDYLETWYFPPIPDGLPSDWPN